MTDVLFEGLSSIDRELLQRHYGEEQSISDIAQEMPKQEGVYDINDTITSYTVELVGLDPQAQSLTLTPILSDETIDRRLRHEPGSFDATQIGLQIPLSAIGGITVISHEVADGRITTKVRPYGYIGSTSRELYYADTSGDFSMEEMLTVDRRIGLRTQYYDRGENVIVIITDYYAASDEQIARIKTCRFLYDTALSLDEGTPLTLLLR
jgi:hypothetical protein